MTKVTAGKRKAFEKLSASRLDRQSPQQVASTIRQEESKRLIIVLSRGGSSARQGMPGPPQLPISAPASIPRAVTCFTGWNWIESN
jgi:hypothetical protein